MAFIKCNYCGKQISDKASFCPHCNSDPLASVVKEEKVSKICCSCKNEIKGLFAGKKLEDKDYCDSCYKKAHTAKVAENQAKYDENKMKSTFDLIKEINGNPQWSNNNRYIFAFSSSMMPSSGFDDVGILVNMLSTKGWKLHSISTVFHTIAFNTVVMYVVMENQSYGDADSVK